MQLFYLFIYSFYEKTPHKVVSTMQRAREAFQMCDEKDTFDLKRRPVIST